MKIIDYKNWKRKEHFEFFNNFDEPFFGIVANVDCTIAYNHTKSKNLSFFAYYLHKSLIAVNQVEEFKYRIINQDVVVFDKIDASPTIGRNDGTFAFSFVKYNHDFSTFCESLLLEIEEVKNSNGLRAENDSEKIDVIHYSSIPWITFTGLSHARSFKFPDSCPKITFGKTFEDNNKLMIPVSIHAHHGFVDGLHVGQFLNKFQLLLNEK